MDIVVESIVCGGLDLDLVTRSGKRQLCGIEDGAEQTGYLHVLWVLL
jgi:hypothetical protein